MSVEVVCVVGARPNFMKIAPIMAAFRAKPISAKLVHTGQHYDPSMSDSFFEQLGIPRPDVNLEVGSASHAVQTADIMLGGAEQSGAVRQSGLSGIRRASGRFSMDGRAVRQGKGQAQGHDRCAAVAVPGTFEAGRDLPQGCGMGSGARAPVVALDDEHRMAQGRFAPGRAQGTQIQQDEGRPHERGCQQEPGHQCGSTVTSVRLAATLPVWS